MQFVSAYPTMTEEWDGRETGTGRVAHRKLEAELSQCWKAKLRKVLSKAQRACKEAFLEHAAL